MNELEELNRIQSVDMRARESHPSPSRRGADSHPVNFIALLRQLKSVSPGIALMLGVAALGSAGADTAKALNFGNQQVNTQSAPQSITVRNPGSLFINTFTLTISDADSVSAGGNCAVGYPMSLGPNKSCTMSVAFLPRSVGAKTGNIYYQDLTSIKRLQVHNGHSGRYRNSCDPCTYSISPTSQAFPASGGTGSVVVTASASGCAWTATIRAPSWSSRVLPGAAAGLSLTAFRLTPVSQPKLLG